jgi:hypothetical protein
MRLPRPVLAGWQSGLAAEQRAYFGYGVLGPHCTGAAADLARLCSDGHDALQLRAAEVISAAGTNPAPAAADYPDLYPGTDPTSAARLAVRLEDECADAWRYLFSAAARSPAGAASRVAAQHALTASAVRAVQWRRLAGFARLTDPFPGLGAGS